MRLLRVLLLIALMGAHHAYCKDPNSADCDNEYNHYRETCRHLNDKCRRDGKVSPIPFPLTWFVDDLGTLPAGEPPVDLYTVALRRFGQSDIKFVLQGLWPSSRMGTSNGVLQPFACLGAHNYDASLVSATISELFAALWPASVNGADSQDCFIAYQWYKHGTCAATMGDDEQPYRLGQEQYFRTAFVLANEFNSNDEWRAATLAATAKTDVAKGDAVRFNVNTACVACAAQIAARWDGSDLGSIPRLDAECLASCATCRVNNDYKPDSSAAGASPQQQAEATGSSGTMPQCGNAAIGANGHI